MLAYAPAGAEGLPLVVVLHGCGQRAERFARQAGWLTLADRHGFVVVAAEQSTANNPNRCFNWFEPHDTRRGEGEAASIAAMVAHAVRTYRVDAARVFITGLSAGGAMTGVMLAAYPDVFAAGAVVAGLPFGVAHDVASAMGAMQGRDGRRPAELGGLVRAAAPAHSPLPRITIWHGEADHTVRPQNASDVARQWVDAHGLPQEGGVSEAFSRWTRTTWREPGSDRPTVELNLVPGLAHGAPLSTSGEAGLGSAGPYMLEAEVSSSMEIARFWGLVDSVAAPAAAEPAATVQEPETRSPLLAVGAQVMSSVSPHVSAGVREVIDNALKRAGLRR
ncbi:MAG TPA: PHB depolymerase family esterase [Phenylobacterium sp.]|jgi:poly(hydroxyalkanoate) depolymerase family esterase